MRRLTAALVVLAAVVGGCDDDGADGEVGEETTPSGAQTTSRVTSNTQPASVESALVMVGPTGVQIVSPEGTSTSVSADPAAAAFGIGADTVVFQDAEESGGLFPPPGTGPVHVWSGGEVRDLAADPTSKRALLLDAAMIEGAPLVLVAERFGEVGPDDTFEELVQIDLRDDTRTTIVRRSAWESGHSAARFLPDGDVVGLFSSEASILLARWTATNEQPIWTAEVGMDTHIDLAIRDGTITLIEPSFDTEQNFRPVLTVSDRDETTGTEHSERSVDVVDPEGEIETGLFCRDWTSPVALVCGRSSGEPIVVSLPDGSFRLLPGQPGSLPTVVRPTYSSRVSAGPWCQSLCIGVVGPPRGCLTSDLGTGQVSRGAGGNRMLYGPIPSTLVSRCLRRSEAVFASRSITPFHGDSGPPVSPSRHEQPRLQRRM